MPHHSKQQHIPMGGASFPPHSSPGGDSVGSHYYRRNIMPPPGISASMSMPSGNVGNVHSAPPPPLHQCLSLQPQQPSWMMHRSQPHPSTYHAPHTMVHQHQHQQSIYRVPVTPLKGDDSSKDGSRLLHTNSLGSSSRDGSPPLMLKQHSRSKSFESHHEIAASVLLLASSIKNEERLRANAGNKAVGVHEDFDDNDVVGNVIDSDSNRKIKKRKNVGDIITMRTKMHYDGDQAYHVSPMSGPTSGQTSPSLPNEGEEAGPNTPSSSYDIRDLDSTTGIKKIIAHHESKEATVQDFPTTLHSVLSDTELVDNVVQWLPDGKSWKIVRWDALRRQVLPKYFPTLSSIDVFLSHLHAWGFVEVTDGPNAGSYSHMFFRRGHLDLCSQMISRNLSIDGNEVSLDKKQIALVNTHREEQEPVRVRSKSILRVPSLATRSSSSETTRTNCHSSGSEGLDRLSAAAMSTFGNTNFDTVNSNATAMGGYRYSNPIGSFTSWVPQGNVNQGTIGSSHPVFVNYRPDEMVRMDQNHHQQQHLQFTFSSVSGSNPMTTKWQSNGGGDKNKDGKTDAPSSPTISPVVVQRIPPYSPIRIRSSRGRHRHLASSTNPITMPPTGRRSPTTAVEPSSSTPTTSLSMDAGISSSSSFSLGQPARTFPVSNRGIGRRPIPPPLVLSRQYDNQTDTFVADELQMLKNDSSTDKIVPAVQSEILTKVDDAAHNINDAGTDAATADIVLSENEAITKPVKVEETDHHSIHVYHRSTATTGICEEEEKKTDPE